MSKFNPKTVPNWVRWIAVDEDGLGVGYRKEPKPLGCSGMWVFPRNDFPNSCIDLYKGKPPKNWKEEIYKWE